MQSECARERILYDFARYMAGRYRLGYSYLALYWAAVLFEGIIWKKSGKQQGLTPDRYPEGKEPNLYGLIRDLSPATLRTDSVYRYPKVFPRFIYQKEGKACHAEIKTFRDVRTRLDNFRYLRNRIMHDLSVNVLNHDVLPHNCDEFICYVWSELASDSFTKALSNWRPEHGGRPVQALSRISADYMIRTIDETCVTEIPCVFSGIMAADFDNLFLFRDKLLGLRARLNSWLPQHSSHLDTDILTTIDTTSAYVWMPLVPKQKKVDGSRKGIWDCSVSILATPLDLRIYLEFGGRARDERECFYRFLGSEEYVQFRQKSLAGRGWQVFDTDWYSAIFNVRSLDSWQGSSASDISAALAKLPLQGQIDPEPITWNRLAHGFILWKSNLVADEVISFERVTEKLEQVIALHGEFMKFSRKEITEGEK